MYLLQNPVLQRELIVNLRTLRSFGLLLAYQIVLGAIVYFSWPEETYLDLTENPESTQRLVNVFFIGQYLLACLLAPSFACSTISGEKERKTYEMLLASPLKPEAILLGKLIASLGHLAVLIITSLPIVMVCLPLGGVSIYEVLAAYLSLVLSVVLFGMISIGCSSFFRRTSAALVVSYLVILPLALLFVSLWWGLSDAGAMRFTLIVYLLPGIIAFFSITIFYAVATRMLFPPDVGSEGKEVVDLKEEARTAIGVVIDPERWPDRLFAPPKRTDLLPDNSNPVYDKEIRSEIFAQGTLMLRVVIQISLVLAIPLMGVFLFVFSELSPVYLAYVILFNVLVGPVFSAPSVTSERERETLDLLLTTTITPWQILWGKLLAGLRVSTVLTSFLLWPLVLSVVMVTTFWSNLWTCLFFVVVVMLTCLTTSQVSLFISTLFRKSVHAIVASYIVIVALYFGPVLISAAAPTAIENTQVLKGLEHLNGLSPVMAVIQVPFNNADTSVVNLNESLAGNLSSWPRSGWQGWIPAFRFIGLSILLNLLLLAGMIWRFRSRWKVSQSSAQ